MLEIEKLLNSRHTYVFNDGFDLVEEIKILKITSSFLLCSVK